MAAGNPSLIKNIKAGSSPSVDTLEKLSKVLGIHFYYGLPSEVEEPKDQARYFGEISAGGGDDPSDGRVTIVQDDTGETVSAPPGLIDGDLSKWGGLLALGVRGMSMHPQYSNGDTIYIYGDDPLRYDPDKLIGRDCAVVCSDLEQLTYLKRIRRPDNGKKGYYNLESINLDWPMMVDMPVHYIYPVRYVRKKY